MHGALTVSSAQGKGTEVACRVPVSSLDAESLARACRP